MSGGAFAQLADQRIIAIVRGQKSGVIERLAQALLDAGIGLMEVTFDQNRPETWEDTAASIAVLRKRFADRLVPGAGTVVNFEQLSMAAAAGAQYIIAPNTNPSIIRETKRLGLLSIPGALTPSEIVEAHESGADAVKVFPAGVLGPNYIKAVRAPISHIPLIAVGGVNETNARGYIAAGCIAVGVGGNLVNNEWITRGEWDRITAMARELVEVVRG